MDVEVLLGALAQFVACLATDAEVGDVLHEMTVGLTRGLQLTGAGVLLVNETGLVSFVTTAVPAFTALERVQQERQTGPGVEAVRTGRPITIADLEAPGLQERWPAFCVEARARRIRAVAGIPIQAGPATFGTANLYDTALRAWSSLDLRAGQVFCGVAASHLAHVSAVQQHHRVAAQLQEALSSRLVIEQAKGVLSAERGISVEDAFQVLRQMARNRNARIHEVAAAVVRLGLRP